GGGGRRALRGASDRRQRSAHRVGAVGRGNLPVAPGAGRVADVPDPRAHVLVRRAGVHVARAGTARSPNPGTQDRSQPEPTRSGDAGEEEGQDQDGGPVWAGGAGGGG